MSWPLHSTAYRRLAAREGQATENKVVTYEEWLLEQATHRGYRYMDGRELTDLELLARLQHHGAATRLVDATRSAFVALWFCVSSHSDTTGALIGIHSAFLGGYESQLVTGPYDTLLQRIRKHDYPFTWEPTVVSPRVAAQHSQFLLSRICESVVGSLCLSKDYSATLVVAIDPKLKETAQTLLVDAFDIRTITLFPDLDGFGRANSYQTDLGAMHRW